MTTSLQTPPHSTPPAPRWPISARVIAAAVLAAATTAAVLIVTGVADRPAREPASAGASPSATAPVSAPVLTGAPVTAAPPAAPTAGGTGTAVSPAYQLLWPFASRADAADWQQAYRTGGHQPWHTDAGITALGFAKYLGYDGIDRVVRADVDGPNAYVAVGFRTPNGRLQTAADVHLIRVGSGADAPWEVVGTRDTTLTLTRPGYGAAVGSPVTVGGRITGVDEQITVRLHTLRGTISTTAPAGVPAGGQQSPWSTQISFRAEPGTVITVAAATGGHIAAVERFAVTAIRVGATG